LFSFLFAYPLRSSINSHSVVWDARRTNIKSYVNNKLSRLQIALYRKLTSMHSGTLDRHCSMMSHLRTNFHENHTTCSPPPLPVMAKKRCFPIWCTPHIEFKNLIFVKSLPRDAAQSAVLLRQVVCSSVTLTYRDHHIGWNSSKIISRLVSLGVRSLQTPISQT